jgi:N-acetylglutamate synthase-like GNAT family acetyltransferase
MFRVERMNPADFPFAVELANTLSWDMASVDFEYMLTLEPCGCFVLWQDHERIGMATCVNYRKMGWFGNLAVKPEFRRNGAGTFLVRHSVQHLKNKGVEAIGLYAYQHLTGFYGNLGFKPFDDFVVLNGIAQKTNGDSNRFPKAAKKDIYALTKFDSCCMGWDRKKLFESLFQEEGNVCYYEAEKNFIQGFVMAKIYDVMAEVGPLVCKRDHSHIAIEFVKSILAKLNGLRLYAYVPSKEAEILELFLESGLTEKFRVTRMFLGSVGAESCIYMPESMERG